MQIEFNTILIFLALDPAGPGFELFKVNLNGKVKLLSANDAILVQVLHTSVALGVTSAIGHADFWVNGGYLQTGCLLSPHCSHERSWQIFQSSLNPANNYVGQSAEGVTELFGIRNSGKHGNFMLYTE